MKNSIIRDCIKYIGISSPPENHNSNFKLFPISFFINLDSNSVKIDDILQIKCDITVTNFKAIKTPRGTSLEGFILTGDKLIVRGLIKSSIKYSNFKNKNKVFTTSHNIPFIESITINNPHYPSSNTRIISPYILDISYNKINDKSVYLTVITYLDAIY